MTVSADVHAYLMRWIEWRHPFCPMPAGCGDMTEIGLDHRVFWPPEEAPPTTIRTSFQVVSGPIGHGESDGGLYFIVVQLVVKIWWKTRPISRTDGAWFSNKPTAQLTRGCRTLFPCLINDQGHVVIGCLSSLGAYRHWGHLVIGGILKLASRFKWVGLGFAGRHGAWMLYENRYLQLDIYFQRVLIHLDMPLEIPLNINFPSGNCDGSRENILLYNRVDERGSRSP